MIAGVLLAAGRSRRMGQPKLLLPWQGVPLVRFIAQQALQTRLGELVVVIGHRAEHMIAALDGLPVHIVRNEHFLEGQSTSLGAGVAVVSPSASAALVLLADQPLLQPATIDALIDRYLQDRPLIVAPRVGDERGNPVLFDRTLFPALQTISGDQGARSVIKMYEHAICWLDTTDRGILLDMDTPEMYSQLVERSEAEQQ
jgi:molybdenum cofactor cytidylyltransferase